MSGCLNIYCYDKKCGLKNVYDAIMTAMGFGVYFLIAVAMIIYSDFRAHTDFHLDMAGYKNAWVIVSFAIILTVVYYAIIIITYCSLKYKIKEEMDKHTSEQISDNKNDILSNLSLSVLNFHDICIFLLTVLFPGLAALIQIMPSII